MDSRKARARRMARELEQELEPSHFERAWRRERPLLAWRDRLALWLGASLGPMLLLGAVLGVLPLLFEKPGLFFVLPFETSGTRAVVSWVLLAAWLGSWFTTRRGAVLWTVLAATVYSLWAWGVAALSSLPMHA